MVVVSRFVPHPLPSRLIAKGNLFAFIHADKRKLSTALPTILCFSIDKRETKQQSQPHRQRIEWLTFNFFMMKKSNSEHVLALYNKLDKIRRESDGSN